MFVRVNSTPNSPRRSVQIVESKRDGHKVKTKILRHVGIGLNDVEVEKLKSFAYDIIATMVQEATSSQLCLFSPPSHAELSQSLAKKALLRKKGRPKTKTLEDILPLNQVTLDKIVEEKRLIEGVDDIAGPLYDKLGFADLLANKKANQRLKDLVLARLVAPQSKHQLQQTLAHKFAKDYDLDALYRLMDTLHPKIDQIKSNVFKRTQQLFPQGISLMLFDVTTLYVESTTTDDLRNFGYSKDHRFNTTQVVLALATNADGLPLGYELFSGNTAEVKTLCTAIEKWQQELPITNVCFVGDRAMFCEANLTLLQERGYTYIVAAKLRKMPQAMQKKILDESHYHIESFANEIGWIAEFDCNGRRLITSYKSKRAMNEAKSREQILQKISKVLAKSNNTGKLLSNKGIKKYTTSQGTSETVLDADKIQADANWDGLHGVMTNIKEADAQTILQSYARLWVIEESFRINKHNLKMRPIYHWKPERIESHIALCYMAFATLRHLQYAVSLTQKVSADEVMEELLNVQASIYLHKETKDRYRVPGHLTHKASKIYKALGLVRSSDATIYQP